MEAGLSHLLFGVRAENMPFYKELLTFLGWQPLYEGVGMLGLGSPGGTSLWFGTEVKEGANDYDAPGLNHLGLSAASQEDVDRTVAYLKERNVPALFETPRHRPEFSGEGQTYYQVMFETPDRILVEVVYTGPKTA